MVLMLIGTLLMVGKTNDNEIKSNKWLIFAILSSVFASFVSLFVKLGLNGISSNLGTLIRTIIVLIFSGFIVLIRKDYVGVKNVKNMKIHLTFTFFVIVGGFFFKVSTVEWLILLLFIALVISFELMNTALEEAVNYIEKKKATYYIIPSVNGKHIITSRFDPREWYFENAEIKRNAFTLLYYNDISSKQE